MLLRAALVAAAYAASASAHATFQEFWIGSTDYGGACVRLPQSNNPVQSVTSNDIICNASPNTSPNVCTVAAGTTVTAEMHQQPGDRTCSTEAIGGQHYGPLMAYMAKVSNATTAAATGLNWFKIHESGLVSNSPDYFANQVLNDNCGHYTFKIPSDIPAGQYLLRVETIALHVASQANGAQFYMSCYQLAVTGGGSANPPTVKFPGAYSASDPGILVDIHQQINTYVIPGPTPYNMAVPAVATTAWPTAATLNTGSLPKTSFSTMPGAPATTTNPPQTTSNPPQTSSNPPQTTSNPPQTTSAPSGSGTVAKFGQCGGQGYTGPTVCASGSTCTYSNAYYSQCL